MPTPSEVTTNAPGAAGDLRPILRAEGLVKRFGNAVALGGVSLDLRADEIVGLCGENGAGKSTLIKVLSGIYPSGDFEGQLYVDGEAVNFRGIADSKKRGIAVIHQELALVPEMTVAENIFLGNEPRRFGFIDRNRMAKEALQAMERLHIVIDPTRQARTLGIGQQQLVEITRALIQNPRILILDEPTAALNERETQELLRVVKDLRRGGISCIYISHRLDEVFELADRILVLRDGKSICTLDAKKTTRNEVIRHMVGRELVELFPKVEHAAGQPLLRVKDLTVAPRKGVPAFLKDISFEVAAGEVFGIGGLMGAGRTELVSHLFGAWGTRLGGAVELNGKPFMASGPRDAIQAGMALVTEDRKHYGLVLDQGVHFNLSLATLKAVTTGGFIQRGAEIQRNQQQIDQLAIRALQLTRVGALSGGNQQKVVIGKMLLVQPRVILLDDPTRGIDVGAKVDVYQVINRLTAAGCAVILVSSEMPELMGMSDRIMVLHNGESQNIFPRREVTQEKLLAAAMREDPMRDAAALAAP